MSVDNTTLHLYVKYTIFVYKQSAVLSNGVLYLLTHSTLSRPKYFVSVLITVFHLRLDLPSFLPFRFCN